MSVGLRSLERAAGAGLGLLLVLLCGCPAEVDPEDITASVVAYGRYELRGGIPMRVEETDRVSCDPGVTFGVDYRLDVSGRGGGVLPLEFRWVHPELSVPERRLWGTETPARASRPSLRWGETSWEGRALWQLEHPDERVTGRYAFEIRVVPEGRVILSTAFHVEGC